MSARIECASEVPLMRSRTAKARRSSPLEGEVARRLGDEQDEQQEGACGEGLREEHPPPADGDHGRLDGLGGVAQVVADEVVDEVDHQHAEDDGELVARDERAADACR